MNESEPAICVANLLADLPAPGPDEHFATIVERRGVRIERIVSCGQATPADRPYAQADDEWVMLVRGAARLWLDGIGEVGLSPGDHLFLPAGLRHCVTWTTPDAPTIWLAVHLAPLCGLDSQAAGPPSTAS
jgi:cupin 2 domain-containing protein